jgi:hypothetical protein
MIEKYSTPYKVFAKARQMFGPDVQIKLSTRQSKKYMILNPQTEKWIHFGEMGYEDYTKHENLMRRERFRLRNRKWKDREKYSPAYLAYHLLW